MKLLKSSSLIFFILLFTTCDLFGGYNIEDLDYTIDGLSEKLNLDDINLLGNFSGSILEGYSTLKELADDLDSIGYEIGLNYIENYSSYDYLWGGFIEDAAMDESTNDSLDSYSTNVQVKDVDEADTVKSDGEYIYIVTENTLVITDLYGTIIVNKPIFTSNYSSIGGILLYNNRVIAYANDDIGTIKIYNFINNTLELIESYSTGGYIEDLGMKNGNILAFSMSNINSWELYDGLFDDEYNFFNDTLGIGQSDKEKAKERLRYKIPNWRNKVLLDIFYRNGSLDVGLLENSIKLYNSVDGTGDNSEYYNNINGYRKLTTFSAESGFKSVSSAGVFSGGWDSYIYSNGEVSVVSTSGWAYENSKWLSRTYLVSFFTDSGSTESNSFGLYNGYLNNQFSMDYYDGYFRVGLTEGGWGDTTNKLLILDISDSEMETVGVLDNLGKTGEQIKSMRYTGDKAYMVTFEQTDPFYTLDLSNPYNPLKVGELNDITGYSGYLHPVDDNTILAIGQAASQTGSITGFQIAVYDVSNFSNPIQSFKYELEDTWSESLWDHHAFRYFDGSLILPLYDYSSSDYFNGFKIFNVDFENKKITEKGRIEHSQTKHYYINPRSMVFPSENILFTVNSSSMKFSYWDSLEAIKESTLDR